MNSIALITTLAVGALAAPTGLRTELIEDTRTVYSAGQPTSANLNDVIVAWQRGSSGLLQVATVDTPTPSFSWRLPGEVSRQSAYRILVASAPELLREGSADVWDSGDVSDTTVSGIRLPDGLLSPATVYYWTVKVAGSDGNFTPYAPSNSFLTADEWTGGFSRSPLQKTVQTARPVSVNADGNMFADFGKAAFGQLSLDVTAAGHDTLTVHLGEAASGNSVNRDPGATVRYTSYRLPVHPGADTYTLTIRPDGRNAQIKPHGRDVRPVLMPDYVGEVYPFRYCEIETGSSEVTAIRRPVVHYRWNEDASSFTSSDSVLNAVWNLCKYSIFATSFAGVYVDGDRERIPYEADALINQLSHYCVDDEYTIARYTTHYLMDNATWPTEWILQAVLLAWNDYLYTGDAALLKADYETLKARTLTDLTEENGLISTRTGRQTPDLLRRCGYYGDRIRDIVDWPQSGALGVGKEEPGEADGYDLGDYNTVVNAYHYRALQLMEKIAGVLEKDADAAFFASRAASVRAAVNSYMLDKKRGCYRDGIGSSHYSLHASMFPMAFGMVPEKYRSSVLDHIRSRGMACSVYGSQFLLDALYDGGLDNHALGLLTSRGKRSWWNMIENGSTVTWEGWDPQFKPNLDWNHAWGAAPANIIIRKLMGVEPVEPGWKRMTIHPRPGNLESASAVVPTILGAVEVAFLNTADAFEMNVTIPSGTVADVTVPAPSRSSSLYVNGGKWQANPLRTDGNSSHPAAFTLQLTPGSYTLSAR
ncbi:MAG: alpha-L-rhamnosidase [Bacteroidales bacterium]|nr:alpha-L-rhamnosidase [Bacteroidales bacterium]